jgi:hypothetical protein
MPTAYAPRSHESFSSGILLGYDLEEYWNKSVEIRVHAREPISLGGWKDILLNEAIEIKNEYAEVGWDGYEASPISEEAIQRARILIKALPDGAPCPELVPSAEGEIAYEWNLGHSQVLSVTPHPHLLVWAASLGSNHTQFGKISFNNFDPWPTEVLSILACSFQYD